MGKPSVSSRKMAMASQFLWLIVLAPVLAISGYSLFFVARYLGVPVLFAIGMSTCFDGSALLCANYSLRYAQEGMAGGFPRTVVRVEALVGAYLQTLHARIGHEPPGSWLLWASLPVTAVTIYEVHLRWERRRALAAAGVTYPATLPAFGLVSWLFFPIETFRAMRDIVGRRKSAVLSMARSRMPIVDPNELSGAIRVRTPEAAKVTPITAASGPYGKAHLRHPTNKHAPTKHIRVWAKQQGFRVGDRARLPNWVMERYEKEHAQEATS